jgi:hypothetical protein
MIDHDGDKSVVGGQYGLNIEIIIYLPPFSAFSSCKLAGNVI